MGQDKKLILSKYQEIKRVPFPSLPKDENLEDLFDELILMDDYVMGIANRFFLGAKFSLSIHTYEDRFNDLSHKVLEKSNEYIQIVEYKKRLDELILLLLQIMP